MANIGSPAGLLEMGEVQATARNLGIETITLPISDIMRTVLNSPATNVLRLEAPAPVAPGEQLALALNGGAPVNAPAPSDSRDPRHDQPWLLPHNSGQLINLAGKVTAPLGRTRTLRLLAAQSNEQRFLYDPLYKYEADLGPARRLTGTFISGHFQQVLEIHKLFP
jgi:hypothetical protein